MSDIRVQMKGIATSMAEMLHSDCGISPEESRTPILRALVRDNRLPTLYEQECLVFGGPVESDGPETDGEGNPTVDRAFPNTNRTIQDLF